jgi:hypothetical protein
MVFGQNLISSKLCFEGVEAIKRFPVPLSIEIDFGHEGLNPIAFSVDPPTTLYPPSIIIGHEPPLLGLVVEFPLFNSRKGKFEFSSLLTDSADVGPESPELIPHLPPLEVEHLLSFDGLLQSLDFPFYFLISEIDISCNFDLKVF